jgi:IclR family mhp operon transcriptional activator
MHAKVNRLPETGSRAAAVAAGDGRAEARQATRPIRALSRGLEVLAELNRQQRAPIHTLSSTVRLPRTTTFRILETLRLAGFVERDPQDDCYRPTARVRALAEGFGDEALAAEIAGTHLAALSAEILWPIEIAIPAGAAMTVRETSHSALALEPRGAGDTLSMLTSAAGRAVLTFAGPSQREALLELCAASSLPEDRLARDRAEIDRMIQETQAQGFGLSQRTRRVSDETTLAIPICAGDRVLATLAVRFAATAVPLRSATEQFLPKMRDVAGKVEREFYRARNAAALRPARG